MSLRGFRVATWDEVLEFGNPGLHARNLLPPIRGGSGFAVDVQLGTNSSTSSGLATITLTTTNTVAAGGLIVLAVGTFANPANTAITITGGSLAWTTQQFEVSGNDEVALAWALAPSGLASGTVLTATRTTGNMDGPSIGAMSFTGAVTSSPVRTSNKAAPANGTAWNGGAITPTAGDLVVVAGWGDGTATTNTPSGGFTQGFFLAQATNNDNLALNYQLSAAGGSITPGGTWGATQTNRGAVCAFIPAAGGGGGTTPFYQPPQLMSMGVGS